MIINEAKRAIELTKAEATKAKVYGTVEYNALQNARKDYKGYSVIVAVRKNNAKNSRVTLEDMRRYITFHDDESKSKMNEFVAMCNAKAKGELKNNSFFKIKKWFFEQYPEVA